MFHHHGKKEAKHQTSFEIIEETLVEFPVIWERSYHENKHAILIISQDTLSNINQVYKQYHIHKLRDEECVRQAGWCIHFAMKMEKRGWTLNDTQFCCYPFVRVRVDLKYDSIYHVEPIIFKSYPLRDNNNKIMVASFIKLIAQENRQTKKLKKEYIGDICDFHFEFSNNSSIPTAKYEVSESCRIDRGYVMYSLCAACFSNDKNQYQKVAPITFRAWNITYAMQ